jgi:hypothetical protein
MKTSVLQYAGDEEVSLGEVRTRGTCKHTGFGEFDNLTGYLVDTYTVEWMDSSGNRWRKRCEVVNLGRPDRGIPVDPDEAMTPEEFEVAANARAAQETLRAEKVARDAALLVQVEKCYREHGALSANQCAEYLKVGKERVLITLRGNPQMFRQLGWKKQEWGLVGVEYGAKKIVPHKNVMAAHKYLLENGPATAHDVAYYLGRRGRTDSFNASFKRYPDLFCVVDMVPAQGHSMATRIWGVVGVHEVRVAA